MRHLTLSFEGEIIRAIEGGGSQRNIPLAVAIRMSL
jgi:hypothetical protein